MNPYESPLADGESRPRSKLVRWIRAATLLPLLLVIATAVVNVIVVALLLAIGNIVMWISTL